MVSFKRKKILFLLFFLFPNDTLFRFLLPIPNSEFGCYKTRTRLELLLNVQEINAR
jgi:hypothetical protein